MDALDQIPDTDAKKTQKKKTAAKKSTTGAKGAAVKAEGKAAKGVKFAARAKAPEAASSATDSATDAKDEDVAPAKKLTKDQKFDELMKRVEEKLTKATAPKSKGHVKGLGKMFAKYDRSGRGVLDLKDLRGMLRDGMRIPEADLPSSDIEALAATLDTDGTGEIDLEELGDFAEQSLRKWHGGSASPKKASSSSSKKVPHAAPPTVPVLSAPPPLAPPPHAPKHRDDIVPKRRNRPSDAAAAAAAADATRPAPAAAPEAAPSAAPMPLSGWPTREPPNLPP